MKCPYIVPEKEISTDYNILRNYTDFGGCDYVFWDHDDGYGHITRVQYCQKVGRKRDVFECLNESEWHSCPHYKEPEVRGKEVSNG